VTFPHRKHHVGLQAMRAYRRVLAKEHWEHKEWQSLSFSVVAEQCCSTRSRLDALFRCFPIQGVDFLHAGVPQDERRIVGSQTGPLARTSPRQDL
jgi:hypothetical protein